MGVLVERAKVWAASMEDEPGGLAAKLAVLAEAGTDLEFVIARRAPDKPGTGVVFVTPIEGEYQLDAATRAGFRLTSSLHSVRVEGDDRPGMGAELTQVIADAGISLRGLSAAVVGTRFVMHLALDSAEDAEAVIQALR